MIWHEIRLFRIALQFLTRIPVGKLGMPTDWLVRSAKYMPLVGALIGAIAGMCLVSSALVFPIPLPTVIAIAAALLLTGALHEDGLADTADALGAGRDQARSLEIMHDSRIGTFGTLALIVVLAFKGAALDAMDPLSAARAMVAGHAFARLLAVMAMWSLPHAGGEAKVSRPVSAMTRREVGVAGALGLIPGLLVLQPVTFIASALVTGAVAAGLAWIACRRFGGYTGDVLGAVEQVSEATMFTFVAAVVSGPG